MLLLMGMLAGCEHGLEDGFNRPVYFEVQAAQDSLQPGLVRLPRHVFATVGETRSLDIKVGFDCANIDLSDYYNRGEVVLVGGLVTARLFWTAEGQIVQASAEAQPIVSCNSLGSWTWYITPTKPGDYEISVIITTLQEGSNQALFENGRQTIPLHIEGTLAYWIEYFGSRVAAVATSVLGILGLSGAAVLAAGIGYMRRNPKSNRIDKKSRGPRFSSVPSRPRLASIRALRSSASPNARRAVNRRGDQVERESDPT